MSISELPRPIALVGAATRIGSGIKDSLAASGFPASRVAFLGLEESIGLVSGYGDEARVVLDAATSELDAYGIVCFCGGDEISRTYVPQVVDAGGIAVDCTAVWADDPRSMLVHPHGEPDFGQPPEGTIFALPSAPTLLLAQALDLLGELASGASATILLPASAAGEAAVQELAQQAAAVLSLEELPQQLFGRQLAFDSWLASPTGTFENRIANQLRRLHLPIPAMSFLRVSTFHGIAATMHLPKADESDVREVWPSVDDIRQKGDACVDSPVRAVGHQGLCLGGIRKDQAAGTWVWLLLDHLRAVTDSATCTLQHLACV